MNAVCTCPEVDPVRRATTYTALMGVEPHAATCPRNGHRILAGVATMSDILGYNQDKPHRCPECHAVTDKDHHAKRGVVECCRCGAWFTWQPRHRVLPFLGVVCDEHRDGYLTPPHPLPNRFAREARLRRQRKARR